MLRIFIFVLVPFLSMAEMMLNSAELENRAQELFGQIRCPVCEGQSIKDSGAELAVKLREYIRAQVAAGNTDEVILAELAESYGESISFDPKPALDTFALWIIPLLAFLALISYYIRFLIPIHRLKSARSDTSKDRRD